MYQVSNLLCGTRHRNDISHSGQLKEVATIVSCPAAKRRRKDLELCGKCQEDVVALAEKMIQCDNCDQWYHYDCVGVDEEDADRFCLPLTILYPSLTILYPWITYILLDHFNTCIGFLTLILDCVQLLGF